MTLYYAIYLFITFFIGHTKERGYWIRRFWSRTGIWILGIKNRKTGETIEEPALYVINHRSLVDPMIIAPHINAIVVAKAEVGSYPVLGPAAAKTGIVFVKREEKSSRQATMDKMRELLSKGENVMIFPEGTTNLHKYTKEYKLGSFRIAAELGIPVVPVVLEYRDDKDLWKTENMIPQFIQQFGAIHTHTKMVIGKPVKSDDPYFLHDTVKAYTDKTLEEMHKQWSTMVFEPIAT